MEQLTKDTNIGGLFKLQKVLDAKIIEEMGLEGQDLLENLTLALNIEIGQLANMWGGFKHWSKDHEPIRENWRKCVCNTGYVATSGCEICNNQSLIRFDPFLEKYADCMSFFLAIANQLNLEEDALYSWDDEIEGDTARGFVEMQHHVGMILFEDDPKERLWNFRVAMFIFANIGEKRLGFEWHEIVSAYQQKNAENLVRFGGQKEGETA